MVTPDSIRYRLVYDAAVAGYTDWWFPAAGLVLLAVFGIGLYVARRERKPIGRAWVFYFGVPFVALWVIAALAGTYTSYASLRDRLRSGQFVPVEGVVQDFQAGDSGDHHPESWAVESNGQLYRYSYVRSQLTPGFRYEAVHGGPVRPGLHVRIADVAGLIARLEIADSTLSNRAPNKR